jgi:hypothetical protein
MQRWFVPGLSLAFFFLLAAIVSIRQAFLFLIGMGLGAALSSARFGFTTGWRDLVERRDPRGFAAQMLLLGLATGVALPLLSRFDELQAALGPVSLSLVLGAFVFGASMQIADGCGSGTLYKAGLGTPLNMAILPLFAFGSFLGAAHLHHWLALGELGPVSLAEQFGTSAALLLSLVLLIVLLALVRLYVGAGKIWLGARGLRGAAVLAALGALHLLLAGQPWGVVYGFGLWAAKLSQAAGGFDSTSNPFWGLEGQQIRLEQSLLLDITSITNIGLLAGACAVANLQAFKSPFKPLSPAQWMVGLAAGFVMGYSARLAFGCNVGAMLSGISTGSLHGWIWMLVAFPGTLLGIRLRRRLGF